MLDWALYRRVIYLQPQNIFEYVLSQRMMLCCILLSTPSIQIYTRSFTVFLSYPFLWINLNYKPQAIKYKTNTLYYLL